MAENQAVVCDTNIIIELFKDHEGVKQNCLSHKPFIGDMFIAATALHFDIELYTLNQKDFHFIPELKLYKPNN